MLINGEKWACEACVRGHRVSSCQHQERPLIHVNKKGRPVSQCHHCRGLRNSRAQHVKCDCAENAHSKKDCPLEKGDNKDHQICCCGHGVRCSCALKKEQLDTVPEDILQIRSPFPQVKDPHKHRSNNMLSHESKTTVFANGHHKPVHKINNAHNVCGAPYKVPARSHTVHGPRDLAQKSSDSLPLPNSTTANHEIPNHHESITSAPQPIRQVKSEHGSPDLKAISDPFESASSGLIIPRLDPNAYSYSPFENGSPSIQQGVQHEFPFPERFPDNYFLTYEQAHEWEPPPPSGGLSESHPEVDWSTFNFSNKTLYSLNNNINSQPPSYASLEHFSHLSHPGLTSSSGELSEVDEFAPISSSTEYRADSQEATNDISSIGEDSRSEAYRLSTNSSYIGASQANLLAHPNLESLDIDDFIKNAEAHTRRSLQSSQPQKDPMQQIHGLPQAFPSSPGDIIGEHPYTIHEAQQYAHMGSNGNVQGNAEKESSMLVNGTTEDPMWSCTPETPGLGLEVDDDDLDWIR